MTMWLNDRDLSIRCVRLKPYRDGRRVLLDVQQVIPLPEAEDYRVQLKEKQRQERKARASGADLLKYDLSIDGETCPGMAKGDAIFAIVRRLCSQGVKPERIMEIIPWKKNSLFRFVEGAVASEDFVRLAVEKSRAEGQKFDFRHYRVAEDELIVSDNRTYAFTKIWGPRTLAAIDLLKEAFPESRISCRGSSE